MSFGEGIFCLKTACRSVVDHTGESIVVRKTSSMEGRSVVIGLNSSTNGGGRPWTSRTELSCIIREGSEIPAKLPMGALRSSSVCACWVLINGNVSCEDPDGLRAKACGVVRLRVADRLVVLRWKRGRFGFTSREEDFPLVKTRAVDIMLVPSPPVVVTLPLDRVLAAVRAGLLPLVAGPVSVLMRFEGRRLLLERAVVCLVRNGLAEDTLLV